MTKPSYEELLARLDEFANQHDEFMERVRKAYGGDIISADIPAAISTLIADRQRVSAELARVRGLLQRGVEYMKQYGCSDSKCRDAGHIEMKHWLAESADIGKLDAVDESDAVCPGCHTRACNGECMRPMRFKGDTK